MRLLYVDDDRINVLLFEEACRLAGALEFISAGSGAEALDLAPAWGPQLLVIDLHLPDTTGYELLPRLRQACGAPLPAFLCTADSPDEVLSQAQAAGFAGCWTKPVDVRSLQAELQRLATPPAP